MQAAWDALAYSFLDLWAAFLRAFAHRAIWEWLLFFFPFYIFGEFPRYILPAIVMAVLKPLRGFKDETEQKRRFLEVKRPFVSVLLVGYQEEHDVTRAVDSLLEVGYENMEIIVVDDGSTDSMYAVTQPYAERGQVRLFKNTGATGRAGRPSASNMALQMARGEFILSVDADTSFDRDIILHMIGPFYDERVGAVSGNLKVKNVQKSVWTKMQAIEYFLSITMWKRWLDLFGMNMHASGAFSAYRRKTLAQVGAWDPELAEDADLSLKIRKAGWKVAFAPQAIAMTNVPETGRQLVRQRMRWDRGLLRTFFRKHGDLLRFWRFDWRNAFEMSLEYFFNVFMTFLYVVWLTMMIIYYPKVLLWVFAITFVLYTASTLLVLTSALMFSERRGEEWWLLCLAPLFPIYKGLFRWVRLWALLLETFRINYEDPYLPESAWRNTGRW